MAKELFQFSWFTNNVFYVKAFKNFTTDSGTPIAQIWTAIAIKRSRVRNTIEESSFTITMPTDKNPAALFRVRNPDVKITVKIFDSNRVVKAIGEFKSIERDTQKGVSKLTFAFISLHLAANIPFEILGPKCRFYLYDPLTCGVLKTDSSPDDPARVFQDTFDYENATISGNTIQVLNAFDIIGGPTYPPGWWEAGTAIKGNEQILVMSHISTGDPTTSSTLTLLRPFTDTGAGVVTLQAGCLKREMEDCRSKFDNIPNFGGFPHINVNPVTDGIT